jgi:hypothetical protein
VSGPTLYSTGWRQGSMFEFELALNGGIILGASADDHSQLLIGRMGVVLTRLFRRKSVELRQGPVARSAVHDSWVISSQDCTLDQVGIEEPEPVIELRPVLVEDPPTDWGIRARRFLLDSTHYVDDYLPRTSIAPAALTYIGERGNGGTPLPSDRALAFKTWLGLRYDRPAVPPNRVELARKIAEAGKALQRPAIPAVRDVLMQFGPGDPPEYAVVAVVLDPADKQLAREWLADVVLRVPTHLGTPARIEAVTTAEASLDLVENSYAADTTQITWRRSGPRGAH